MKNINEIWALLEKEQIILNQTIIDSAKSEVDLSNQLSHYILGSGGKRIRPLTLLLLAKALNYQGDLHYKLATAVEFIHTATLLHDDVVDESDMRRGRKTANNVFGNSAAVLVGDFLYTRAFQMITNPLGAAQIMADATNELAKGEVMQLMNIANVNISEADYFQVIHLKTSVLFGAACQFAGELVTLPIAEQLNLRQYGYDLGQAFQIADDVLDYIGDIEKTGKNIGDDLAESKMTLPIIHALEHADEHAKNRLREILQNGERHAITEVQAILMDTRSIDYTLNKAYQFADKAKLALASLPESIYKEALLAIPDIAVKRSH